MMAPRMMRGPDPMTANNATRDVLRTPKQQRRRPGGDPQATADVRVTAASQWYLREVALCLPR